MTKEIEVIRIKIGMVLWDAEMHPIVAPKGFLITTEDGTKARVIIEEM